MSSLCLLTEFHRKDHSLKRKQSCWKSAVNSFVTSHDIIGQVPHFRPWFYLKYTREEDQTRLVESLDTFVTSRDIVSSRPPPPRAKPWLGTLSSRKIPFVSVLIPFLQKRKLSVKKLKTDTTERSQNGWGHIVWNSYQGILKFSNVAWCAAQCQRGMVRLKRFGIPFRILENIQQKV